MTNCDLCFRRCDLRTGSWCGAYAWAGDRRVGGHAGAVREWAVMPIESKPVLHYRRGTRVLALGTAGCNLGCRYCLNHDLSGLRALPPGETWSSADVIERARKHGCDGLAWTFNEGVTWFDFMVETSWLARAVGLYTVLVTNGAYTPEAMERLIPVLDVWRVDLKGWSETLYTGLLGAPGAAELARANTARAQAAGLHVEVVTCLVPGWHEGPEELVPLAAWIRDTLGPRTPWHLLRFHPQHQLREAAPYPLEQAHQLARQAREQGLERVTVGGEGLAVPARRERHYDFLGPGGSFLRLTLDLETGKLGYVGDEAVLAEVLEACREAGWPLSVSSGTRCG